MLASALIILLQAAEEPKTAVTIAQKEAPYSYEFSWSKEAAEIPALDTLLRKRADESKGEIVDDATTAQAEAKRDGGFFPDMGYELTWDYATAGNSEALLSLSGGWFTYTGGAHGLFGAYSLLWDKSSGKEIELPALFERVTEYALLHPKMCAALKRERKEKRESEEQIDSGFEGIDEAFNGCPKFEEITGWIADDDKDGKFDTFMFAADPYVAGPYVEGTYEMKVQVTERMIAALKPAYRASFEAQPQ